MCKSLHQGENFICEDRHGKNIYLYFTLIQANVLEFFINHFRYPGFPGVFL